MSANHCMLCFLMLPLTPSTWTVLGPLLALDLLTACNSHAVEKDGATGLCLCYPRSCFQAPAVHQAASDRRPTTRSLYGDAVRVGGRGPREEFLLQVARPLGVPSDSYPSHIAP